MSARVPHQGANVRQGVVPHQGANVSQGPSSRSKCLLASLIKEQMSARVPHQGANVSQAGSLIKEQMSARVKGPSSRGKCQLGCSQYLIKEQISASVFQDVLLSCRMSNKTGNCTCNRNEDLKQMSASVPQQGANVSQGPSSRSIHNEYNLSPGRGQDYLDSVLWLV